MHEFARLLQNLHDKIYTLRITKKLTYPARVYRRQMFLWPICQKKKKKLSNLTEFANLQPVQTTYYTSYNMYKGASVFCQYRRGKIDRNNIRLAVTMRGIL